MPLGMSTGRWIRRSSLLGLAAVVCALAASGCAAPATNPAFGVSVPEARAELRERQEHKVHLERPVIVLAGYLDPGVGVARTAAMLRKAVEPEDWVVEVPFFSVRTFDACRARVITKVINRFGTDAAGNTAEVDVVGVSMGGIVARYAAAGEEPRLRIERLFTVSSPHRGAIAAEILQPDSRAMDMRPGSKLLRDLDGAFTPDAYEIVSYVRLGDGVVGETAARGPDERLWWVPNRPFSLSHLAAPYDPRIIADIVRRLAGEEPWTCEPCTPLPCECVPEDPT